jgi:hypothetical protein
VLPKGECSDHAGSQQKGPRPLFAVRGNRINNGYTVGPNNQLFSDGTHTYTYDEEGNRTSRTHIASGEVTEYHWDHRNRLVRVSTRATANGPLGGKRGRGSFVTRASCATTR